MKQLSIIFCHRLSRSKKKSIKFFCNVPIRWMKNSASERAEVNIREFRASSTLSPVRSVTRLLHNAASKLLLREKNEETGKIFQKEGKTRERGRGRERGRKRFRVRRTNEESNAVAVNFPLSRDETTGGRRA